MAKPTGFLEYERVDASYRPVSERIKDYDEFVVPQTEEAMHVQAARCMDCGVSFCHGGFVVNGLSIGCPLSNLIPEINDLVYRGKYDEAWKRLSKTHPFPEFTSRVCPALCEGSCTLGEHEPAVTVKEIERLLTDRNVLANKVEPRIVTQRTGKKVAVIGSGPSGLACADMLNQLGDTVTVYERNDRPGGLLMYGIPNMKLDKSLVLNRVEILKKEGVTFVLNTQVEDGTLVKILKDNDAIVLCTGATKERMLVVPGSDLEGVLTAMTYLTRSTKSLLDEGSVPIDLEGKHIIVVGGGDTGTDCVGTSIRKGAASVTQLEIMPELPENRAANNPWPLWPRIRKTDYGQKEAIELFGKDPREYEVTVKEIVGEAGKVTGVKTIKVEWTAKGPKEIPGTEELRRADLVITAMGFTGPEDTLISELSLKKDPRGNILTKENRYKSSLSGVFAAGDTRRGPSLVVWALMEGRKAAAEVHAELQR
ncbi:MAG: glutamate synthase subunit beta [Clostridiales Family XIII bacterium]|jgi:glutamate synthase (NADPH/NADH) small chain|nr:glutamate synthase subunit beta [Clostridiales Family XIII bacterium]